VQHNTESASLTTRESPIDSLMRIRMGAEGATAPETLRLMDRVGR